MKTNKTYMAIDQYGQHHHDLGPYPRKALLARFGRKHASKMYCDLKSGGAVHTGWIVAGHWLSVYEVTPMRRAA